MRRRLLELLASPCCRGPLDAEVAWENEAASEGRLRCRSCRQEYPIISGVPRLLAAVESDPAMNRTRETFAWEWERYPGPLPEDDGIFIEETQIPAPDFKGRLTLDAGCGMGRYSLAALRLGAEVVAFDLSDAALRLAPHARDNPRLHVVQGNLLHPPFREGIFDIVYSLGVLHHTPDTETAFRRTAELVRPRGLMTAWVYGKAGRFEDFATNPLRSGRNWIADHRRSAWAVVAVRHALSDLLRVFTVKLGSRLLYALCYPLAALGAVPLARFLTFSIHPDFKVRLIENFDWISPPFQHHHTKEELERWFQDAGFTPLKVLPHGLVPKPGILGRRT